MFMGASPYLKTTFRAAAFLSRETEKGAFHDMTVGCGHILCEIDVTSALGSLPSPMQSIVATVESPTLMTSSYTLNAASLAAYDPSAVSPQYFEDTDDAGVTRSYIAFWHNFQEKGTHRLGLRFVLENGMQMCQPTSFRIGAGDGFTSY